MDNWIFQSLIVVPAIIGSILLSFAFDEWELTGWSLYLFSDILGTIFFVKRKLWLMTIQYIIFTLIALNAVYQRIGDVCLGNLC